MWITVKMLDASVSRVPVKSPYPPHLPLLQPLVEPGCWDDGTWIHSPSVSKALSTLPVGLQN